MWIFITPESTKYVARFQSDQLQWLLAQSLGNMHLALSVFDA